MTQRIRMLAAQWQNDARSFINFSPFDSNGVRTSPEFFCACLKT